MKVTLVPVPSPELDPVGFELAVATNLATISDALEMVVDRTVTEPMLADIEFAQPAPNGDYQSKTMNGVFRWRDPIDLTSSPYSYIFKDGIKTTRSVIDPSYYQPHTIDGIGVASTVIATSTLREPLLEYLNWPVESIGIGAGAITSGDMRTAVLLYSNWPMESMGTSAYTIDASTMIAPVVTYANWPVESLGTASSTIDSGTLS